jgi:hypothetical protein
VSLQVEGGARAALSVGQTATFHADIEVPPKTGVVVKAEWDFEGAGDYPIVSETKPESRVTVTTSYAFTRPGTYFPALRVTCSRHGDRNSPYAQVQNLGRVRVVVT